MNATTQVLVCGGILTPPIAEALRIREGCYNDEGVPRNYATFPTPPMRIDGADVVLGSKEFRSTLVHKFTVGQPKTAGENDIFLELKVRLHFDGKAALPALVDHINKSKFLLTIAARQQDLKFGDETEEADEEETDDRQMELPDCVDCANDVPFMAGSKTTHASGQPCTAKKTEGATLASVSVMGEGRRKKRV